MLANNSLAPSQITSDNLIDIPVRVTVCGCLEQCLSLGVIQGDVLRPSLLISYLVLFDDLVSSVSCLLSPVGSWEIRFHLVDRLQSVPVGRYKCCYGNSGLLSMTTWIAIPRCRTTWIALRRCDMSEETCPSDEPKLWTPRKSDPLYLLWLRAGITLL